MIFLVSVTAITGYGKMVQLHGRDVTLIRIQPLRLMWSTDSSTLFIYAQNMGDCNVFYDHELYPVIKGNINVWSAGDWLP